MKFNSDMPWGAIIIIALIFSIFTFGILIALFGGSPHYPNVIAKCRVDSLTVAIKSYEGTYGLLPWAGKVDLKFSERNSKDYDKLLEILTCVARPGNDKVALGNPRKIRFLDVPDNYSKAGFVDPWGQRFNIYLDLDYDNKVKIGGKELEGTVFVYSSGPNKKDEEGEGDDICSWKD